MTIVWDPDLSVGVEAIDAQHAELFRRLDRLFQAARAGLGTAEVTRLVDFLRGYVVEHFAAEEALMSQLGYPEADSHRAEHQGFLAQLDAMQAEQRREGATAFLVIRVQGELVRWLRHHIYRTDRRLGAFARRPRK